MKIINESMADYLSNPALRALARRVDPDQVTNDLATVQPCPSPAPPANESSPTTES